MNISSIGQDSHRFVADDDNKPLILGGIVIDKCNGLDGNSDADVVLHAITNAISGISCINILGKISDDLCLKQGITDSKVYLQRAIETLGIYKMIHIYSFPIFICLPIIQGKSRYLVSQYLFILEKST